MRYRVITRGQALAGFDAEYVRKSFAAHFQLSEDLTRELFSGQRFVIKSNLDLGTARTYVDRLADIGLEAEVQEIATEDGEELQLLAEPPAAGSTNTIVCPSCGSYQDINLRCIYCGLVFDPPETAPRTALTRQAKKPEAQATPGSFMESLAAAPKYPLAGAGPYVILGGTLFLSLMDLIVRLPILGALFALVTIGYLSAYMVQIVRASADGRSSPPDWPEMGHWGHLLVPLFFVAITWAVSFSPVLLYVMMSGLESRGIGFWVLIALGIVYFPMAFLALVMTNLLRAITPIFVVPSILRVWRDYLVACVLMALVYFFSYVARAFVGDAMPIIGALMSNALGVYFMLLEMRIIGILFLAHEEELNWFD